MCRLIAMVSDRPRCPTEDLMTNERSLLVQSDFDPDRKQSDGWGTGRWTGAGWDVFRSPGAVYREKLRFRKVCRGAVSSIVLAHIRSASNPRNLPKKQLISLDNCQPFGEGRYLFVHNGVVTIPDEVAATLGAYKKKIRGINDSEVLFWLVMRNLRRTGDILKAFSKSVSDLWSVWETVDDARAAIIKKEFGRFAPYHGLNCLISDGKVLHAFCKHDGASRKRALCGPEPVFELCHIRRGSSTVIASEPTDRTNDWVGQEDRTALTVFPDSPGKMIITDI